MKSHPRELNILTRDLASPVPDQNIPPSGEISLPHMDSINHWAFVFAVSFEGPPNLVAFYHKPDPYSATEIYT